MADFDTWSPITSFKELKLFLAYAVWRKCCIYQLDFIGTFLHAIARNQVFTSLPNEWREWFPELADWFGVPLRLLKSIYGSVDSSCNWDDTLKDFLFRFGFKQCNSCSRKNILPWTNTPLSGATTNLITYCSATTSCNLMQYVLCCKSNCETTRLITSI